MDVEKKRVGLFAARVITKFLNNEELELYDRFREGVKKIENELETHAITWLQDYKRLSTNLNKILEKRIARYIKRYGIEL